MKKQSKREQINAQIRKMDVWVTMSTEDRCALRFNESAAEVEHCAHVTQHCFRRWAETKRWADEARAELAKLNNFKQD